MPISVDALKHDEPINVFDLPQLYTKPSHDSLLTTLELLTVKPTSWNTEEIELAFKEDRQAIASYLTKIISNSLSWLSEDEQSEIWELAAGRLAERTGRTGMPAITRTFTIPTIDEDDEDLKVSLHEPSLTGDWVGFKTWGSAFLLAQRLQSIASMYLRHLSSPSVLELGSGTGLAGLVAAALWSTDVTLSDLFEILPNLAKNAETNRAAVEERGGSTSVQELNWVDTDAIKAKYHIVMAVDALYSIEHAGLLVPAIDGCLKHNRDARVLIATPLRDKATERMLEEFTDLMRSRGMGLLVSGDEFGFEDWEVNGERARVHTWWGIWARELDDDNGA